MQAVQKVGLIGLAIGQPNKASEALIKAVTTPQPDKGEEKKVCDCIYANVSRNRALAMWSLGDTIFHIFLADSIFSKTDLFSFHGLK